MHVQSRDRVFELFLMSRFFFVIFFRGFYWSEMAEAPTSPAGGSHESGGEQSPHAGGVREQDRYLPIANISRIMKKALPANGKIAKDAKDTVQECVSEFISFITSEYVMQFNSISVNCFYLLLILFSFW